MTAIIIRGDARRLPLPDASVDLICTSPPYFALRSYQDGGQHYVNQIGSETTPAAFVDALVECTREMVRVLKPSGSLFVNLGDKYANDGPSGTPGKNTGVQPGHNRARAVMAARGRVVNHGLRAKSLIGIPWRYALRCIDDLGLILRAEIIWDKPNGLPESVTDRVRRSHEQWFHLVKQPRYYSAIDEVREAAAEPHRSGRRETSPAMVSADRAEKGRDQLAWAGRTVREYNPLGKLPGSVWSIPSQPLTVPDHLGVDHFAAFPCEWPRRIILGWTPGGICVACGEGRRPVTEGTPMIVRPSARRMAALETGNASRTTTSGTMIRPPVSTITGYACACPAPTAPTRPAVVLDPFGGTGTTALVASALGRIGISVDLSHDYSRLAQWRTADPAERAKALHVDKPPPVLAGQLDMWKEALT